MIHAHVPTQRPKPDWKVYIKSREDYDKWIKSGMFWVYWPDLEWKEVESYLEENK